jgi:hypothetical protein
VTLFLRSILFFFIFFLPFIQTALYPDPGQSIQPTIEKEYSAGNILGFTKYLISRNEFYRAFVELKRLESYYPGYIKKENIFTTELFLLYNGHRYSEIISAELNDSTPMAKAIYTIFQSDVFLEKKDFIKANMLISSGAIPGINKDIDLFLYKRTILSYLLLNKIDEARKIIDNRKIDSQVIGFNDIEFSESIEYSERCFGSLKKPYKAIALGLIPGMGYVYADQTSTGIIAFVLISVLSALTYYSFKTDNKPVGVFIGTAAGFFYGGSIIGGYLAAKKYNDASMNELKESLTQKMSLADDRERIYNQYGVGSAGK